MAGEKAEAVTMAFVYEKNKKLRDTMESWTDSL
jgi:hypothetical protein